MTRGQGGVENGSRQYGRGTGSLTTTVCKHELACWIGWKASKTRFESRWQMIWMPYRSSQNQGDMCGHAEVHCPTYPAVQLESRRNPTFDWLTSDTVMSQNYNLHNLELKFIWVSITTHWVFDSTTGWVLNIEIIILISFNGWYNMGGAAVG